VVLDVWPIGMQHVLDQLDGGAAELALSALIEGAIDSNASAFLKMNMW
jgi:hypothetical protein